MKQRQQYKYEKVGKIVKTIEKLREQKKKGSMKNTMKEDVKKNVFDTFLHSN